MNMDDMKRGLELDTWYNAKRKKTFYILPGYRVSHLYSAWTQGVPFISCLESGYRMSHLYSAWIQDVP